MVTAIGAKRASLLRRFARIAACLLGLGLLTLVGSGQIDTAEAAECNQRGQTTAEVTPVENPPIYNTNSGWIYGKPMGVIIPRGAEIRICEERVVGFPPARQKWYRIRWEGKEGWIYSGNVKELAAILLNVVASLFVPERASAGPGTGDQSPPLPDPKPVIFLVLLVGMVAKNAFDFYKVQIHPTAKGFLGRMMPAFVVSPYPFTVVVGHLDVFTDKGFLALWAFAFETGFFFQDISSLPLEKLRARISNKPHHRPNSASRAQPLAPRHSG